MVTGQVFINVHLQCEKQSAWNQLALSVSAQNPRAAGAHCSQLKQ